MRNMSFALTTEQVLARTKTVTRRLGWLKLRPGDYLQPVRKCMGLRKGEHPEKLGCPLRVVSVDRHPLRYIAQLSRHIGRRECGAEGFPEMTPEEFVGFFCGSHKGCTPDTVVTRISFVYEPDYETVVGVGFEEGRPFFVVTRTPSGYERQHCVEYCRRDGCLYYHCSSAGGGTGTVITMDGEAYWLAPGFTASADSHGRPLRRVSRKWLRWPFYWGVEELTEYCSVCDDYLPTNSDAPCPHIRWDAEAGAWVGEGVGE